LSGGKWKQQPAPQLGVLSGRGRVSHKNFERSLGSANSLELAPRREARANGSYSFCNLFTHRSSGWESPDALEAIKSNGINKLWRQARWSRNCFVQQRIQPDFHAAGQLEAPAEEEAS
jgi:hypothetical protein